MITDIKKFIIEKKKNPSRFNYLKEEFEDTDMPEGVDEFEDTDMSEEEEEGLTFENFKNAVEAEFSRLAEEAEEDVEPIEAVTDEQLNIIFSVVEQLTNAPLETETEEEFEEGEEFEEDEEFDQESVDEVFDFLRGGSKEEIAKKKEAFETKVSEILNKYKGQQVTFAEKGDNKNVPFSAEVANKVAKKNNYLGKLSVIARKDTMAVIYTPGDKGMAKLGAGTNNQTSGK